MSKDVADVMAPVSLLLNILWIVIGGAWMALGWMVAAIVMAITIIGLPWARAAFNIAVYTLFPFGRRAVSRELYTEQNDVAKLTSADVATYRDDRLKIVAPATIIRELNTISHAIEIATREWGVWLPRKPCAGLEANGTMSGSIRRIQTKTPTKVGLDTPRKTFGSSVHTCAAGQAVLAR